MYTYTYSYMLSYNSNNFCLLFLYQIKEVRTEGRSRTSGRPRKTYMDSIEEIERKKWDASGWTEEDGRLYIGWDGFR